MESAPREFEGRLTGDKDWREIVAWVGDLPPMPQVASRAISLVENPDTTASDLTELLATDAALAARVLKIANSAMFSRQREISTLNMAIMVIGFKALKGIIVAATLRQLNKSFGALERQIWESSMAAAMCATTIAKRLKKRYIEEIFLLGLLHNLGQIVLLFQPETRKDYKRVLETIASDSLDFASAEQKVFGFAHPLIGALVAKKWNFAPDTCQVILHYRDPLEGAKPETELEEKTAVVQLATFVSHGAGIGNPEGYPSSPDAIRTAAIHLGVPEADVDQWLAELSQSTLEQFQSERHVYE